MSKQSDQFLDKVEEYRVRLNPELDADLVKSLIDVQRTRNLDVLYREFEKLVMDHIEEAASD